MRGRLEKEQRRSTMIFDPKFTLHCNNCNTDLMYIFLDSACTLSTLVYPIEVFSVETDDSSDQISRIILPSTGSQLFQNDDHSIFFILPSG